MTKAEIIKTIDEQVKAQTKAQAFVKELIELPSVGVDATIIATLLTVLYATICDGMTTLAKILCEMMPEKEDRDA